MKRLCQKSIENNFTRKRKYQDYEEEYLNKDLYVLADLVEQSHKEWWLPEASCIVEKS